MLGELIQQARELTIIDMEASIEHLSRGTIRHVDTLLIVVEPYYRSLETAGRTAPLARDLGIAHVYAVANKLRDERDEAAVREYCARQGIELLAAIPFDPAIAEADRGGVPVIDHAPGAPALEAVRQLAARLAGRS